ncbi:hypothetical protein [Nocardia sp. XZ_19_385]|uniref:hypothetical protein n=1 Tax=Nocardia sp. XZ_19_385 TaxID=2769488 RepID=UPI0018902DF8|nr:hypothetical protein [Nocardia sp. XZ_19_385]
MPPRDPDEYGGGTPGPPELELPGNPWPDIAKRSGDKGWLKFKPEAAADLGQAISNFQWNLFSLRGNATSVSSVPNLAVDQISSGSSLAKAFGKQGEYMYQILGAHHKILDDMLDSVIAAGKNMVSAEEGNVEELNKKLNEIKSELKGSTYQDGKAPGRSSEDRHGSHTDKSKQWQGRAQKKNDDGNPIYVSNQAGRSDKGNFDIKDNRKEPDIKSGTFSAGVSEMQYYDWDTLYKNKLYLDSGVVADMIADDAAEWKHMGEKLREWTSTFGNKINDVLNPAAADGKIWEGEGAAAMKAALEKYRLAIDPLAGAAEQQKILLEHMSGVLVDTKSWLRPYSKEEEDPRYYLSDHQHVFGQTYVRGVNFVSGKMPKLPSPTEAFNGVPPIYDPRDKNKDGKIGDDEKIPGDKNNDGKVDENEQKELAEQKAKENPGGGPPGGTPGGKPGGKPGGTPPGLTAAQKKAQADAEKQAKKIADLNEKRIKDGIKADKDAREAAEKRAKEQDDRAKEIAAANEQRAKDAAKKQEAAQKEASDRAKQQATAAAAKEGMQAAQQAAQQGMEAAQKAVQEALAAGQKGASEAMSAAQQAAQNAMSGLQNSGLPIKPGDLAAKLGGPGPGPSSLAKGLGLTEAAKLFPRAGAATAAGTGLGALGRAGAASPMAGGTPGSPGSPGAAGRGAEGANQAHKRPAYLDSDAHLDELLGEAPKVVRPVVEQ